MADSPATEARMVVEIAMANVMRETRGATQPMLVDPTTLHSLVHAAIFTERVRDREFFERHILDHLASDFTSDEIDALHRRLMHALYLAGDQ